MPLIAFLDTGRKEPEGRNIGRHFEGDIISIEYVDKYPTSLTNRYSKLMRKNFVITKLHDPVIEAVMKAIGQRILSYPYATYEIIDAGVNGTKRKMKLRSSVRADYNTVSKAARDKFKSMSVVNKLHDFKKDLDRRAG